MNKKKILKLFTGLSTASLAATSSLILTSCSNNNSNDDFTSGFLKSMNIRFLPSSRMPFPIYALPYNLPYFMAPNFEVMNIINGTPLDEGVVIDPETGWPEANSLKLMTYQQFFMNTKVAQEMSPTGNEKESLGVDGFKNLAKYRHDTEGKSKLNLKGAYLNDDYADETIKAFNCPYFYDAYNVGTENEPVYASVYSSIRTIDLSNNNLWYLPFFGYNSMPYGQNVTDPYIMRGSEVDSSDVPVKIGFENLGLNADGTAITGTIIDLKENQLTILPYADFTTGSGEEAVNYSFDITNLFASDEDPYPWTNAIAVDGNCFGYDLKDTGILANFTKYKKYQVLEAIDFNKDTDGKGYQSYAI